MLGHNAQIAHIEALKLTQSKNLSLKRYFINYMQSGIPLMQSLLQSRVRLTNHVNVHYTEGPYEYQH